MATYTISTSRSLTSSWYVPYAFASFGVLMSLRNSSARDLEEEDAAATIVWVTSETPRVFGSQRRSLAKAGGSC